MKQHFKIGFLFLSCLWLWTAEITTANPKQQASQEIEPSSASTSTQNCWPAKSIFKAITQDDLPQVKKIVLKNPEVLQTTECNHLTPLFFSLVMSHPKIADYLLDFKGQVHTTFVWPTALVPKSHISTIFDALIGGNNPPAIWDKVLKQGATYQGAEAENELYTMFDHNINPNDMEIMVYTDKNDQEHLWTLREKLNLMQGLVKAGFSKKEFIRVLSHIRSPEEAAIVKPYLEELLK